MLTLDFALKNETKTCYRFEAREGESFTTLYLKKEQVDAVGLDARKGITVTVTQKGE